VLVRLIPILIGGRVSLGIFLRAVRQMGRKQNAGDGERRLNAVSESNIVLWSASELPDHSIKSSADRREKCVEEFSQPDPQSWGAFGFYGFGAKHFRDQNGDAVLGHFVGRDIVGIGRPRTKAVSAQHFIEGAACRKILVLQGDPSEFFKPMATETQRNGADRCSGGLIGCDRPRGGRCVAIEARGLKPAFDMEFWYSLPTAFSVFAFRVAVDFA